MTGSNEGRWRGRPLASALAGLVIWLTPLACGFAAGVGVGRLLPAPAGALAVVGWWAAVVVVSSGVATGIDRLARRLAPLTTLLRMTMLFPDQAPSRLKVARRVGNISELKRRVAAAQAGGDARIGEAAELILSLSAALSNHDRKTRGHAERTRAYTELLGEELRLAERDRDRLRWAALLHDLGKLEVPAEILNKDGPLTEDEWGIVRRHPEHGMRLAAPLVAWLGEWATTIEHHHERWDGSGYPHGLRGTAISYGARIVSVADAYDVMTSGRSYRKPLSPADARAEVARHAGRQFDPKVVRALMTVSLGRLRWAGGPLAVLAEVPFVGGLQRLSQDLLTVLASTSVVVLATVAGLASGSAPVEATGTPGPDLTAMAPVLPTTTVPAVLALPEEAPTTTPESTTTTVAGAAPAGPGAATPPSAPGGPATTVPIAPTATTVPVPDSTTTTVAEPTTTTVMVAPPTTTTTVAAGPTTTTTLPPTTTTTTLPPTTTTTTLPVSAPAALSDAAATDEDTAVSVDVLANDSDPDGDLDPSSLAVVAGSNGSATVSGGAVVFTPTPDVSGVGGFAYRICDLGGRCTSATAEVLIRPVNDPPVAGSVAATGAEDSVLTIPLPYSDPDGDALVCLIDTPPTGGSAVVTSECAALTYLPDPDRNGADRVVVAVSDGTEAVRGVVDITIAPVNDPPAAVDDAVDAATGIPVAIAVLSNDFDADGDPLTVGWVGPPTAGSAVLTGSTIVFTAPGPGTFSFAYGACDPSGECDDATVRITVGTRAVANDDAFTVDRGNQKILQVLANDTGDLDQGTLEVISGPDHGTIANVGGSGNFRYRPVAGYSGPDEFVYRICSFDGTCDTATVSLTVQ